MSKMFEPNQNVMWYLNSDPILLCNQDMHVDVAIVGGGMAGLCAAQAFVAKGKKVALFEKSFCGSGASGKSSGFITSNSELSLTDFAKKYNPDAARQIWKFINGGVELIRQNIEQYGVNCGYVTADSLLAAVSSSDFKSLQNEYANLDKLGFQSILYDASTIRQHVDTQKFYGGVVYENTFGINAYEYCRNFAQYLKTLGVLIYEETAVTKIDDHTLTTAQAKITADYIVICVDRALPDLGFLYDDVYQVQNFVVASKPLTDEQVHTIFPQSNLMVWDSNLLYNYFRLTADRRIVLGGSDLLRTYVSKTSCNYAPMVQKLTAYFKNLFPKLDLEFQYQWAGLIGISKDIVPIAGMDKDFKHIFYITAVAGLPIAAACGAYSAACLLDGRCDMDPYFSPYRSYLIQGFAQKILGKKLSFAISNAWSQSIP